MNEDGKAGIVLEHVFLTLQGNEAAKVLFEDLNLQIGQGEIVALTGASGSGKSTLLQLMAGFRKPDAGRIKWRDTDLASMDARNRRCFLSRQMGFVYQDYQLIPAFTAAENVMVPLLCGGMSRPQARGCAMDMLERVNLADKAADKPPSLSGGEQQRTAVARALVCRPSLVLADEPTANLDPENAALVWSLLEKLYREGSTVIIATHDKKAENRAGAIRLKTESGHSVPEWI